MKHALITGGSRRLGLFITQQLLTLNWRVTVLTRTSSLELNTLSSPYLTIKELDYGDHASLASFCDELAQTPLDLILHNASIFEKDPENADFIPDALNRMMLVHVQLPAMINTHLGGTLARSDNGNIVHMSDIYVDNPNEAFALYCSSKAALENLSKSFAKKLAPNVRVNTIQPGALKFLPNHTEEEKQKVLDGSLLPIEAGFEPIFKTIQYIMDNSFITGTSIKVDGGRALCR